MFIAENGQEYIDEAEFNEVMGASALMAAEQEALRYLASTDWYTTRSVDTGVPVPTDVATKRAEARAAIANQ